MLGGLAPRHRRAPAAIEPNSEVTFRAESGGDTSVPRATSNTTCYRVAWTRRDGTAARIACTSIGTILSLVQHAFAEKLPAATSSRIATSTRPRRKRIHSVRGALQIGARTNRAAGRWSILDEWAAAAVFSGTGSHGLWLVTSAGNLAHAHITYRLEPMQVREFLEPSLVATQSRCSCRFTTDRLAIGLENGRRERNRAVPRRISM